MVCSNPYARDGYVVKQNNQLLRLEKFNSNITRKVINISNKYHKQLFKFFIAKRLKKNFPTKSFETFEINKFNKMSLLSIPLACLLERNEQSFDIL